MTSATNERNIANGLLNCEVASAIEDLVELTSDGKLRWQEEPSLGGPFGPLFSTDSLEGYKVTVGLNESVSDFTIITTDEDERVVAKVDHANPADLALRASLGGKAYHLFTLVSSAE